MSSTDALKNEKAKKKPATMFPVEKLCGIREFKAYNKHFIHAILTDEMYTKEEAVRLVNEYFKRGFK